MAMSGIQLKPKTSGGKGGLWGKILGGIVGAIGGAFAGGPGGAVAGGMAGAGAGMAAGGILGELADPYKVKERNPLGSIESTDVMGMDPEVQAQQLADASKAVDMSQGIPDSEMSVLKTNFAKARERLLAANAAKLSLRKDEEYAGNSYPGFTA